METGGPAGLPVFSFHGDGPFAGTDLSARAIITPMGPLNSTTARRLRLIGIADPSAAPWEQLESAATRALEAGLPALMLRDHELPDTAFEPIVARMRVVTRARGALLLLNRRPGIARRIDTDGVHVGKDGPSVARLRHECPPDVLIGYSAHAGEEARLAFEEGADYVFFSPVFDTPSKRGVLAPAGLEVLKAVSEEMPGPVIALGGIDVGNVRAVMSSGASGVAMIRGIFSPSRDAAQQTRELLALVRE